MANGFKVGIRLNFGDVGLEVGVGVRVRIGQIDFIVFVRESVLEWESEVGFVLESTAGVTVFVVVNIFTTPVPTKIFRLGFFLTVNHDLHAHLVQWVLFVLIDDVKLDIMSLESVGYLEKKPLWVSISVDVILE